MPTNGAITQDWRPAIAARAQRSSLVQRKGVSRAPGAWETPGHGWTEDMTRGEPGITPG